MGIEGIGFDELEGVSPSFAEALYRQYRANPQSVEPDWREYFQALEATVSGPRTLISSRLEPSARR